MEEFKCTCGGTFQCLGPEHLRVGKVEPLGDRDWNERSVPGMLYACDRCRCLRFCADEGWLRERSAWWEGVQGEHRREAQYQAERLQAFLEDFREYSDQKLERIASASLFSGYDETARAAARQLLEERRANPASPLPEERERGEESRRDPWSRRKPSKPPWEG